MSLIYHNGLLSSLLRQDGNCICSPNNCFSFFKSAAVGYDESTQEAIKYLFNWDDDSFANSFDLFDHQLKKQSTFFNKQESVLSPSRKNNFSKLGCIIEDFDIQNPDSKQNINHIKNWIESSGLINTLSLNIDWDKNYPGRKSSKNVFHQNNDLHEVEFVELQGKFEYGESQNLDAKIVEIPLDNEDLKLVLILPNKKDDITDFGVQLSQYDLEEALGSVKKCWTTVSIPKFKLKQEFDLRKMFSLDHTIKFCSTYRTGGIKALTTMEFSENGLYAAAFTGCEFTLDPIIKELIYETDIANRYATTVISSRIQNYEEFPQEATFAVALPEDAFISEFLMEIEDKTYKSHVKAKEEANEIYEEAVAAGKSAAQVAVNARNSNQFTVSINLEPRSDIKFSLTYEELLHRRYEQYEFVVNIQPGQLVNVLEVNVNINESRALKFVKTPAIRSGNKVSENDEQNGLSTINISDSTAVVKCNLNLENQVTLAERLGTRELQAQFVVQYDVELDPSKGDVLVSDGYFVHFYAPDNLPPLAKHVVFSLDTSGSMWGRKIEQLIDAMQCILDQTKKTDLLDISEFTDTVTVHDIDTKTRTVIDFDQDENYNELFQRYDRVSFPSAMPANDDIVKKAKAIVGNMSPNNSTHMIAGLQTALFLVKRGQEQYTNYQPILIFLTDGAPTDGITDTDEIVNIVTKLNEEYKTPIFGLSFGDDADKIFLRKISLSNFGFSRHIYEASDASLQLQQFYRQISSPLLSHVTFKYDSTVDEVTKTDFPIYFRGSDIVVCGKHASTDVFSCVNLYRQGELVELKPDVIQTSSKLERLWAYLTIKQLLEQRENSQDQTELTRKALDLALKYSFVTEVTSLVVVKPDEVTSVDTERAVATDCMIEEVEEGVVKRGRTKKKVIKKRCIRKQIPVEIIACTEFVEEKAEREEEVVMAESPVSFIADRPFLMMVQLKIDNKYVSLFIGRIMCPFYN